MPRALSLLALSVAALGSPAWASQPPPGYCQLNPDHCPALSRAALRRYQELLARVQAILPSLPDCRWSTQTRIAEKGYGQSPDSAIPRELWLASDCIPRRPRGGAALGPTVYVEPRFGAADYPAEGEILESAPDLYLADTRSGRTSLVLIVGPRGQAWVSDRGTMKREGESSGDGPESLYYRSPFLVALTIWIGAPEPAAARALARDLDRARLLAILRDEERRRQAFEAHAAAARQADRPESRQGLDYQAELTRVVQEPAHRAEIKDCYERARTADGRLRMARIAVEVEIRRGGAVKKALVRAPPELATVGKCISRAVERWRFPTAGTRYEAAFPLLLQ